jgi:hypothetical protein
LYACAFAEPLRAVGTYPEVHRAEVRTRRRHGFHWISPAERRQSPSQPITTNQISERFSRRPRRLLNEG